MKKNFQQSPNKLFNQFAAAYNEPTINFPDSDTIGGAAVLSNGNFTFQVKEPVYDMPIIKDPIISESVIVPFKYGGGIIAGKNGNSFIDGSMNPMAPVSPLETPVEKTETNPPGRKTKNIAIGVIVILVIVGIIFLMRKK